ncbi:hypothetical protein [Ulvibacterium sp.]|uniref:hypothetical protein n=1 Tax=Ulvibacterium sp. TaxID=2665914 RepID=UPI003BAC16F3
METSLYRINLGFHAKIALAYFMLAAILGVVLRSFASVPISVNYKFIVHTHSHIALLGWLYLALTTLLYKLYLDNLDLDRGYRKIFWFTQFTLVGMLLTFPFMGYALFSIVFSTLFLFASYWFVWFFIKNIPTSLKKSNAYQCVKFALWYMVLSSLGPWALGGIMNTLGAQSVWYRLAIYFYLHFLYNGWMILALVGILLRVFEIHGVGLSRTLFKSFFWSINLGIILSFFLSTLFAHPPLICNVLGGIGALLQLVAFGVLLRGYAKLNKKPATFFNKFQESLLRTVIVLLIVKMVLQLLTALPYFANLAATLLDFTIGYLHWTFLGVITISLFLFLDYLQLLRISQKAYFLYLFGFILTEILIFYRGIAAWQSFMVFKGYYEMLLVASFLIPIGLGILLGTSGKRK